MIEEGKYAARAESWALGVTDNGKEYIAVGFKLAEITNQTVIWRGYFTDKTAERTIESLRYCGWTGDNLANLGDLDKNLVQVVIGHNEYDGKTYANVSFVNKLGGTAVKTAMTEECKKAFAERMKGLCMKVPKNLANAGQQPTQEKPMQGDSSFEPDSYVPPHTDDDLPF